MPLSLPSPPAPCQRPLPKEDGVCRRRQCHGDRLTIRAHAIEMGHGVCTPKLPSVSPQLQPRHLVHLLASHEVRWCGVSTSRNKLETGCHLHGQPLGKDLRPIRHSSVRTSQPWEGLHLFAPLLPSRANSGLPPFCAIALASSRLEAERPSIAASMEGCDCGTARCAALVPRSMCTGTGGRCLCGGRVARSPAAHVEKAASHSRRLALSPQGAPLVLPATLPPSRDAR